MDDFLRYLKLGFTHVIPYGYDHTLFILCISLTCTRLRSLFLQCSVFTLAHSITLGLSTEGMIPRGISLIEPLIAFTILCAALENIILSVGEKIRLLMIFIFGLVHGMGFASALLNAGLPKDDFFSALLSFNFGVELGQIVIVLMIWLMLLQRLGGKEWYFKRIVYPASSLIACIAFYWTLKRLIQP